MQVIRRMFGSILGFILSFFFARKPQATLLLGRELDPVGQTPYGLTRAIRELFAMRTAEGTWDPAVTFDVAICSPVVIVRKPAESRRRTTIYYMTFHFNDSRPEVHPEFRHWTATGRTVIIHEFDGGRQCVLPIEVGHAKEAPADFDIAKYLHDDAIDLCTSCGLAFRVKDDLRIIPRLERRSSAPVLDNQQKVDAA